MIAFKNVDYAFLIGARPRTAGMERKDLLQINAEIFSIQGKALNAVASREVKVLVTGNPANTNCLIAATNAPNIPAENFGAMTRLDHNRAIGQVAEKTGCAISDIQRIIIWGNHSSTQYPDLSFATIRGLPAKQVINDNKWIEEKFIPDVQQRGAAVIKARGASSAASAANGGIDHMRDFALGSFGHWVSMAVPSTNAYGIGSGVFFSYPCICEKGTYKIVPDLLIDEFSAKKIAATKRVLAYYVVNGTNISERRLKRVKGGEKIMADIKLLVVQQRGAKLNGSYPQTLLGRAERATQ